MKNLKKKIGWVYLSIGSFTWLMVLIGMFVEGWKEILKGNESSSGPIFVLLVIIIIPILTGAILLIGEKD